MSKNKKSQKHAKGGVPYGLFNEEEEIYMVEKLDNPYEPDDELPF